MTTTNNIPRGGVSPSAVSVALIVCSLFWHASACIYFATSGLSHDWSATPLIWVLGLVVTPAVCFAGGMILFDARKRLPFTFLEQWALAAIFMPVTLGTLLAFWAIKVLLEMSGV